jgi:signal transduction histidine kinase
VDAPEVIVSGAFAPAGVVLSFLIALLGSYVSLELLERVAGVRGRARTGWLIGSSLAQGLGIWAMHFTGMLAFQLPLPTRYSVPGVALSFAVALGGTVTAVTVVCRPPMTFRRLVLGAAFMGGAMVGLHDTAMAALRAEVRAVPTMPLMIIATILAFVFSLLSLWLTFLFQHRSLRAWRPLAAALVLAVAMCGMHYTAMAATTFFATDASLDSSSAVPISSLGSIAIGSVTAATLGLLLLTSIVDQRRRARIELQRSFDQLRALAARLQRVREDERKRVAREIHDELGQALTSIKMDAASLMHELPADGQPLRRRVESIMRLADQTIQSVRAIATELRPGVLDDLGLVAAVEWAAEDFQSRSGVRCTVYAPDGDISLDADRRTALFRIFQETLTNISRHAHATEVRVKLAVEHNSLVLEVEDNGRGIDERALADVTSLGILGMRERAVLLGGDLTIRGMRGKGTTVLVCIPNDPDGRHQAA